MTDVASAIRQAIEEYVALVEAPDVAMQGRLDALPRALDRLALAAHEATFTFDETDYRDAPRPNRQSVRALVQKHFPQLGYYNLADPTTRRIGEASIIVGDGVDDVEDILCDLKEVLWRWDHASADDALWFLTQSYSSHWGLHLRSLQYYLHVLASGVDEAVG